MKLALLIFIHIMLDDKIMANKKFKKDRQMDLDEAWRMESALSIYKDS